MPLHSTTVNMPQHLSWNIIIPSSCTYHTLSPVMTRVIIESVMFRFELYMIYWWKHCFSNTPVVFWHLSQPNHLICLHLQAIKRQNWRKRRFMKLSWITTLQFLYHTSIKFHAQTLVCPHSWLRNLQPNPRVFQEKPLTSVVVKYREDMDRQPNVEKLHKGLEILQQVQSSINHFCKWPVLRFTTQIGRFNWGEQTH